MSSRNVQTALEWQAFFWKQAVPAWKIAMASWETIFYRSLMISDAHQGKLPLTHPEFTRMGDEKVRAFYDGCSAGMVEMQRLMLLSPFTPFWNPHRTMSSMLDNSAKLLKVTGAPSRRTASANARRLRRRSSNSR